MMGYYGMPWVLRRLSEKAQNNIELDGLKFAGLRPDFSTTGTNNTGMGYEALLEYAMALCA